MNAKIKILSVVFSVAMLLSIPGQMVSAEKVPDEEGVRLIEARMPREGYMPPRENGQWNEDGNQRMGDMPPGHGMMMQQGQDMMQTMGMAGPFYHWGNNFIIHKELFDLSEEQERRITAMMSQQERKIIQLQSELRLAHVDLKEMIRENPLETDQIHELFRKIADLTVDFKMENYRVYSAIMKELTDDQRKEAHKILGEPTVVRDRTMEREPGRPVR